MAVRIYPVAVVAAFAGLGDIVFQEEVADDFQGGPLGYANYI